MRNLTLAARIDEIAHENAILLQKMSKIMAGTDRHRKQEPVRINKTGNTVKRKEAQAGVPALGWTLDPRASAGNLTYSLFASRPKSMRRT